LTWLGNFKVTINAKNWLILIAYKYQKMLRILSKRLLWHHFRLTKVHHFYQSMC